MEVPKRRAEGAGGRSLRDPPREDLVQHDSRRVHIASLVDWQAGKDLGTYSYAEHMAQLDKDGSLDHLDFEYLRESGAAVVGDPDRCVELAERYQASGCDLLLCLVNPYKIEHEAVMKSIELMGKHVLPAFA